MRDQSALLSFVDKTYLAPLRRLQNKDGGWSFNACGESRIELATAWALLALQEFSSPVTADETLERGTAFS